MIMAMMLAMTLAAAIPALAIEIGQENEQDAESGEVDQEFSVTGEGDNSNQCANVQGVAQTGNSQNLIDLLPAFSVADDYEFDEVGSTIDERASRTQRRATSKPTRPLRRPLSRVSCSKHEILARGSGILIPGLLLMP